MAEMKVTCRLSTTDDGTTRVAFSAAGDEAKKLRDALKGVEDQSKKTADAGVKLTEKQQQSVDAIGKLAGITAGAITALAALAAHQTKIAEDTLLAARRIGTTTEQLSALGAAARRNNADLTGVVGALDSLAESAGRAAAQGGQGARLFGAAFAALQISVRDASTGALKPAVQLLDEVAGALDKLPNGALKTRLANQLLGASARDLNGFLHELATKGLAGVQKAAQDTNQVLTTGSALAMAHFRDIVKSVGDRITAFARDIAGATVPALIAMYAVLDSGGNKLDEAGRHTSSLRGFMDGLGRILVNVVGEFKVFFTMLYGGIDIVDSVQKAVRLLSESLSYSGIALYKLATGDLKGAAEAAKKGAADQTAAWEGIKRAGVGAIEAIKGARLDLSKDLAEYNASLAQTNAAQSDQGTTADEARQKYLAELEALRRLQEALKTGTDVQSQFNLEMDEAKTLLDEITSGLIGPELQALRVNNAERAKANKLEAEAKALYAAHKISIKELSEAEKTAAAIREASDEKYRERLRMIREQNDLMAQATRDLAQQNELWGVGTEQLDAVVEGQQRYNELLDSQHDFLGKEITDRAELKRRLDAELPSWVAMRQAINDVAAAQAYARGVQDQYRSIVLGGIGDVSNALGQFAARQIKTFHDLWHTLIVDAQNFIAQLIAAYLRLEILQPWIAGLLGWGPALGGAIGTAAATIGTSAAVAGGAGVGTPEQQAAAVVAAQQGGSSWSNYLTGYSLAKNGLSVPPIFGGGGWGGVPSALWYGSGYQTTNLLGTGAWGPGMETTFTPSLLGKALGWLGGIVAGYNQFKAAGGGIGGTVGAAAYGIGTVGAVGALGGILSGAGAAAGMTGAMGTIGLGAFPVLGWIALGAMALNAITGGGLFGTKWKTTGGGTTAMIGPEGATTSAYYTQERKAPFFGLFGGDTERTKSTAAPSELTKAAQDLFDYITRTVERASESLGIAVPEIVSGAFKSFYDKSGNLTKQQSEILGKVYTETFEDFAKRLTAENLIAVVEAAVGTEGNVAAQINTIADQWRDNATKLLEGAEMMVAAQIDVQRGYSLTGAGTTVADVVAEVVSQAKEGESLLDTYERLKTALHDLQAALDVIGIDIGKTGAEFVTFAAQVEEAAGGADKAQKLWEQFFGSFYTTTERLTGTVKTAQRDAEQALTAIGMDSTVKLADFRAAFEAALPNLTPDEVAQWLIAGAYLAQLSQASADLANWAKIATTDLTQALATIGISIDKTGDDFTAFAEQIVDAAGGIDAAENLWATFFKNFYSATDSLAGQLKVTREAADAALTAIGVDTGVTMKQFKDQFEAILPTLTPEQIVQWLTAGNLLASATAAQKQYNDALRPASATITKFQQTIQAIDDAMQIAIDAAEQAGLAEYQLGWIHFTTAKQTQAAIEILRAETADLIAELYGGVGGTLDEVNRQIEALQGNAGENVAEVDRSMEQLFEQWMAGLKQVKDYLASLATNTQLTTLTPEEQLAAARTAYESALTKAKGGDVEALGQLSGLANTYLTAARSFFSSGDMYTAIFDAVRGQLGSLASVTPPGSSTGTGGVYLYASPQLQALFDKQAELTAEQTKANRLQLAVDLEQHLHDLADAINTPVLELTASLGVNLAKLAEDVGVDLKNLDENSVLALAGMANQLGLTLSDLVTALGLSLTDLNGGLAQLAMDVGIDLNSLSVDTVRQLADMARNLGTNLDTITASLAIDLGNLADAQSLMNQALGDTISDLPADERAVLEPLFNAIADATTAADANAAIEALKQAVEELPAGDADLLKPFFDDLNANAAVDPVVYRLGTTNDYLADIKEQLVAMNYTLGTVMIGGNPVYASGTRYVPTDQFATVHAGEMVIDANSAAVLRNYGIGVTVATGDATTREVAALRADLDQQAADNRRALSELTRAVGELGAAQNRSNTVADQARQRDAFARR